MSPDNVWLDEQSDLFSLGGVLHVIATGERWPGDLTLLRAQRPDLPLAFGDLVASLHSEPPGDRPPSARSVLTGLDEIRHASNIGPLIAAGESDQVEFKSSLHHPYGPPTAEIANMQPGQARKAIKKILERSITKTIAAFLNARRQVVTNAFGPEVWSSVNVSLVPHAQHTVAVVRCSPRASETWHLEDGAERFYVRT